MNKIIIANCKVCKQPFRKLEAKNTSHRLMNNIRQVNSVTCSRDCARKLVILRL
jgi:hypothetical protein